MMLFRTQLIILLLCLFNLTSPQAKELISTQCKPLVENRSVTETVRYSQGLLWKISKGNHETSYLFGTIHVSDTEITTLPAAVDKALHESDQFVMEAIPDLEQMLVLTKMMFFSNGKILSDYIDAPIYEKTKEILSAYHLGADAVSTMKPWAAFLMMNYPPDQACRWIWC